MNVASGCASPKRSITQSSLGYGHRRSRSRSGFLATAATLPRNDARRAIARLILREPSGVRLSGLVHRVLSRPQHPRPVDRVPSLTDDERELIERVRPYTITPPARIVALADAVAHVVGAGVTGAFVECGVWRGGS